MHPAGTGYQIGRHGQRQLDFAVAQVLQQSLGKGVPRPL
jgi:hypothetical protein